MKKLIPLAFIMLFAINANAQKKSKDTFKDPRDKEVYRTMQIGDQVWMCQNLRYEGKKDDSCQYIKSDKKWEADTSYKAYCAYDNKTSYVLDYGFLYTREAALEACPVGWHLPTVADWDELKKFVGGQGYIDTEGQALKASFGWEEKAQSDDVFSFSAVPGGHRTSLGEFEKFGAYGFWWTSNPPYYYNISNKAQYMSKMTSFGNSNEGMSVRCIKDNDEQASVEDTAADECLAQQNEEEVSNSPQTTEK